MIKILEGPNQYDLSYALFKRWPISITTEEGVIKITVDTVSKSDQKDVMAFFGESEEKSYEAKVHINSLSPYFRTGELVWL